jgi:hypothetical protein
MWVTGTLVYGLVVIIVNVKVLFSTYTHTFLSTLVNLGSIASFFFMFYFENTLTFIPQLSGAFLHAIKIPSFYFLIVFFVLFTVVTEIIMFWVGVYHKEKKEIKKIEEEKRMLQQRKEISQPSQHKKKKRYRGFAYDGDTGAP